MALANEVRRLADDELLIERSFAAPAALMFRMWSEREHLIRWLGPKDFKSTHLEMDFRPGGAWRACIVSDRYGESWMGGRYLEIEPDARIVFTFAWDEAPGRPGQETVVTISFAERNGRTVQSFHQAPFADVATRDSHVGGWSECFDREQAYVEARTKEAVS